MSKIIKTFVKHKTLKLDFNEVPLEIKEWAGDSYIFDHYELTIKKNAEFDFFKVVVKDLNLPENDQVIIYHDVFTSRTEPIKNE